MYWFSIKQEDIDNLFNTPGGFSQSIAENYQTTCNKLEEAVKLLQLCSEELGFDDTELGERVINWLSNMNANKE